MKRGVDWLKCERLFGYRMLVWYMKLKFWCLWNEHCGSIMWFTNWTICSAMRTMFDRDLPLRALSRKSPRRCWSQWLFPASLWRTTKLTVSRWIWWVTPRRFLRWKECRHPSWRLPFWTCSFRSTSRSSWGHRLPWGPCRTSMTSWWIHW